MLPEYEISTDPARLDISLIHEFLSGTYWAPGRSRIMVERSIKHSLCFGAYVASQQIGFARVISDRAVFAYLADVFVLPEFRGRGIGKGLVRTILEHPELRDLKVFLLCTRDADGFYSQFGFCALPNPEEMMGRYT